MTDLLRVTKKTEDGDTCRCVVRIRTTYWASPRGLHTRKDVTFLRKLCRDFNLLEEDSSNIGAEEAILRIVDFFKLDDGVYEVGICNESHDWETGCLDDYDYTLTPLTP